jgi:hypothetical protein
MHSMQHVKRITTYLILLLVPFTNISTGTALAVEAVEKPAYPSPILITEIQTGAGSAGDEFVELFNASDAAVDVTGWQVRYLNASSTSSPSLLATLENGDVLPVVIQPGEYYVLHTASVALPETVRGQVFSAKLSSADKTIALFAPNPQICMLETQDALAWGTSTAGEGGPLPVVGSSDRLISRYVGAGNYYVDRNANVHDAVLVAASKNTSHPAVATGATPGAINSQILPQEDSSPPLGEGSSLTDLGISGCVIPEPADPDNGLEPPDEEPPSSEEPTDTELPEPSGPKIPAADVGLKSPQLTELLPNPDKPLTDAADEFVELYNSNTVEFDLSGFRLEAGASATKRRYTFPAGTKLPVKSFKAFFSSDTHLNLSNTQGLVRLIDPLGNEISTSTVYPAAKANLAWALVKGSWQWTTRPTPNAANILAKPIVKVKKGSTKSTSTKPSTTGFSAGVVASANTSSHELDTDTKTSLHTGVLALIGGFALLYGAYEYRSDVANKLHQLRLYREARREARQSAKGR